MPVRNIKRERKLRGWTMEDVAKKVGVKKQSISALENGETDPSYKTLCRLEKIFNRSHKFLFGTAAVDTDKEGKSVGEHGGEAFLDKDNTPKNRNQV